VSDSVPAPAENRQGTPGFDASNAPADPSSPARARTYLPAEEGRKASALAQVWERLEATEELLATMGGGLSVTQKLMDRFGITRRQARAMQAAVRMRWIRESTSETRAQRKERYRRTLEQVVKQGFERQITVCTNRKDDEYEVVPQPDLKAVTAATALLLRIDGADQPEAPGALPPGETPASDGAVQVVDRSDLNATLRARRATPTGGGTTG